MSKQESSRPGNWWARVLAESWESTVAAFAVSDTRPSSTPSLDDSTRDSLDAKGRERERRIHFSIKEWNKGDIVANWKELKNTKRVRQLIWKGIPPRTRETVWPLALGNNLNINGDLFKIYLEQAERAEQIRSSSQGATIGKEGSVRLISLDLPRTFPALSFFADGCPMHADLERVLKAYVCYRPDIGYVQGMSYIAAVMLLFLDDVTAFQCLANLLNCPLLLSFYRMEGTVIDEFVEVITYLMDEMLPKLAQHLKRLDISAHVFVMDWVLTLFAKSLPLDHAARIWDNYFIDGEIFIFRTILGILKLGSKHLLASGYDNSLIFLTHLPEDVEEETLFKCIYSVNLDLKALPRLKDFLERQGR